MDPIAFDVAAGILMAFLPIFCLTLCIHEKRNARMGGAWVYGIFAFIMFAGFIAGGLDSSVWR